MRRKPGFKRGRAIAILIAGSVSYAVSGWHITALRSTDLSAAQAVALRFPENWSEVQAADLAVDASNVGVVGNQRFALLSPTPMVWTGVLDATVTRADGKDTSGAAPSSPANAGAGKAATAPRSATPEVSVPAARVATVSVLAGTKPNAAAIAAARHKVDRPGFMLNDAQIASIKQRLHLTSDQEQMWPAVEAALRNIAYSRAREAHQRGVPASAVQLASADPDSVEVQGLKSAAIPLIMSFSSEQKDEVRNLAHVMGLDQLASQF